MLQVFHLNIVKLDLVLHMLQCDPPAASAYCSCWGTVHACGKRRDDVRSKEGWWQGRGRSPPIRAAGTARAVPFVAGSIGMVESDKLQARWELCPNASWALDVRALASPFRLLMQPGRFCPVKSRDEGLNTKPF
jgi:hypothetical protein